MRYVSWNPALETGLPEIDQQHMELYALVNDLNAAALVGTGPQQLERMLHRILRYASVHFATEEALMADSSYTDSVAHAAIHAAFAEQVQCLAQEYAEGHGKSVLGLAVFMQDWLESHIQAVDRPLVDHLREWRASEAPSV